MHIHEKPGVEKRFIASMILTGLILAAEIFGGLLSGSLALLSDAAHVFSDIFALGLSYMALRLSARPPDDRHSFGWHRLEIIAAFINGASLLVIAFGIWIEAFKRWQNPLEIRSTEMMVIAIIGLLVNIVVAFILGGHDQEKGHTHDHAEGKTRKARNLNIQSAFLHVIGDLISSVGVILAAILIRFTSATWIDPLASILIGIIIFVSAYRVLRASLHILIEGVPEGLSISRIKDAMLEIKTVSTVHDLHVWNLCSDHIALSAHILLMENIDEPQSQVLEEINHLLKTEFDIQHTTLQLENNPCAEVDGGCN